MDLRNLQAGKWRYFLLNKKARAWYQKSCKKSEFALMRAPWWEVEQTKS
jgi:hypothetical protein